jgi:organic radical activating enzyme
MNYFLISITNQCNKSCEYCVVKDYINNAKYPSIITATDVIYFLKEHAKPLDTVEITGGEPTMFKGLLDVLQFCKTQNLFVILRTNGYELYRDYFSFNNMIVVLAQHNSSDEFIDNIKRYFRPWDILLKKPVPEIYQNPETRVPVFIQDSVSPLTDYKYDKSYYIMADGTVAFMPCYANNKVGDIWHKVEHSWQLCSRSCSFALGAWNLISRLDRCRREMKMEAEIIQNSGGFVGAVNNNSQFNGDSGRI